MLCLGRALAEGGGRGGEVGGGRRGGAGDARILKKKKEEEEEEEEENATSMWEVEPGHLVLLFPAGTAPLGNLGKSINSSTDTKELSVWGRQPLDTAGRLPARPLARRPPSGGAGWSPAAGGRQELQQLGVAWVLAGVYWVGALMTKV